MMNASNVFDFALSHYVMIRQVLNHPVSIPLLIFVLECTLKTHPIKDQEEEREFWLEM